MTFLHVLCSNTLVFGAVRPLGQCFLIRGPRIYYILLAEHEVSFFFQAIRNLHIILIAVAVYSQFIVHTGSYIVVMLVTCEHCNCNVSTASVQGVEN
jgi:predicted ATPase